jgi:energy-coupling factor transport system ATP-binding protein
VLAGEALSAGHGREPLQRWPARTLVRHIGTVFADPEHQFLARTVREELRLGPRRVGLGEDVASRRADELLDRLHLGALAAANPFTLSGGEKRRLSVATALATAPALLVLDEPTFGQDRRGYEGLLTILGEHLDGGACLVVATHDARLVDDVAARIVEMDAGWIVRDEAAA